MAKRDFRTAAREGSQLNERLIDYTAVTRIASKAKTLYRRAGNWPIYAAATGSALAMATGASASIISGVYPGSGIAVNPGGPVSQVGLIPGLSVKLHALSNKGASVSTHTAALQLLASHENIFFSGLYSDQAKKFKLGSPIGTPGEASHVGHTENVQRFFLGSGSGNFASGQVGFVGLSFANLGNTDYAWIELEFTDKGGFPYFLDALAFGVDTDPGQLPGSFEAGQTGPSAPEPGTMSLAILAAGAAGVMALRRRRKQS
jgi:hypothetical protein